MPSTPRTYELLAPVADMEMCAAAVHNGADAIYVGFPGFNARGRTQDYSWEALGEMIDFCHKHDVKVFLALNVLIFENELRKLLDELPKALALRPDAFIIQDLGLVRLIRFLCPSQALHASTQMTVTNHESIALTEDLDLARYVLGREVSLDEMEIIRANTGKELEVFVHGALCVSYSGQCLTSEGFGGRSANRGQCAQSCRMEYDLIVDGEKRDMGARRYLVSPKDLCGLDDIPRLMELGIDSFKIEGRLKTPQYVASTTSAYKKAMADARMTGAPAQAGQSTVASAGSTEEVGNLQVTYSRGFFNGWLGGVNHQKLVDGRYGSHRGLEIGTVLGRRGTTLRISSRHPLSAGDGLMIVDYAALEKSSLEEPPSWGARIFSAAEIVKGRPEAGFKAGAAASPGDAYWDVTFGNDFRLEEIPVGACAYLNDSPALERDIRRSYSDRSQWKTLPVNARSEGKVDRPLSFEVRDESGRSASAETSVLLQHARNPATALTREKAVEEAGALTGTGYHLDRFDFDVPPGLFMPEKELRKVRQAAMAQLLSLRDARPKVEIRSAAEASAWMEQDASAILAAARVAATAAVQPPRLNLLIRERSSLEALAGLPLDTVYLDFEHGKDYKPALQAVRDMGFRGGIATTRILKPSEYHNLKVIESLSPDAVLVRNLGALQYFTSNGRADGKGSPNREVSQVGKPLNLVGDFSLNVSNSLTAAYLLSKGLSALCPSYDLNQWQLFDLIDAVSGSTLEITVHQYLPSFHMEHCVFAAFMSQGTSFRDCGKPCESHRVELRDHTGALHPLKADQECRNTMFNGKPQSAAMLLPSLLSKGVRRFRVEALTEDAEALRAKVLAYAELVNGAVTPSEVFSRMGVVEKYGVMEGQLRSASVHRDRKKA